MTCRKTCSLNSVCQYRFIASSKLERNTKFQMCDWISSGRSLMRDILCVFVWAVCTLNMIQVSNLFSWVPPWPHGWTVTIHHVYLNNVMYIVLFETFENGCGGWISIREYRWGFTVNPRCQTRKRPGECDFWKQYSVVPCDIPGVVGWSMGLGELTGHTRRSHCTLDDDFTNLGVRN